MKNTEPEFAQVNQLMVAERSILADVGVGGEIAKDLGKIIERAQQAAYRSVDVMLVYRNWFIGKRIAEEGVKAGLSAAKWMRMAKVSKPTATRDLGELMAQGAIVSEGLGGPETRYCLNTSLCEPIDPLNEPIEGLNEGIKDWLVKLVNRHPGVRLPYLKSVVGASTSTVERAIAALVKAGRIEHRGSKKTGGYYLAEKK